MKPEKVREVWGIVVGESGQLLPPVDDDPGDSFMAFASEDDARLCMQSQIDKGYIDAGEVRRLM